MKRFIPYVVILVAILAVYAFVVHTPADRPVEFVPVSPPPLQDDAFTANEDGLIEVIFPENVLGGWTAGQYVEEALANPRYMEIITDVFVNEYESATVVFTMEQLLQFRYSMHLNGQLHHGRHVFYSIKEVIYETEMLTEITVIVDKDLYMQNRRERIVSNQVLAMNAGTFQVLSGVAPEDWHTTITVRDYFTGEVISSFDFPRDDMYTMIY